MRRILKLVRRARRALAGLPSLREPGLKFACLSAAVLVLLAGPASSQEPAGLSPVRKDVTPKDQRRVESVTKPTTDFSKPEQFELMQGGSGT